MPSKLPIINFNANPKFIENLDRFVNEVELIDSNGVKKIDKRYTSRAKCIIDLIKTHPDFKQFVNKLKTK